MKITQLVDLANGRLEQEVGIEKKHKIVAKYIVLDTEFKQRDLGFNKYIRVISEVTIRVVDNNEELFTATYDLGTPERVLEFGQVMEDIIIGTGINHIVGHGIMTDLIGLRDMAFISTSGEGLRWLDWIVAVDTVELMERELKRNNRMKGFFRKHGWTTVRNDGVETFHSNLENFSRYLLKDENYEQEHNSLEDTWDNLKVYKWLTEREEIVQARAKK